jgi:predicted TPR repeat methyltransferase
MADVERAGYLHDAVALLLALPEFPAFRTMLDLGGGPGLIGMTIVAASPTMTGIIFDLHQVVKATRKYIHEYSMEARMDVLGGDFNRDSIGEGYDLVWMSIALQFAWSIDAVVQKVYVSLNLGGVFASLYPFGYTHERTKPESMVLSLLPMTLLGQAIGVDHGLLPTPCCARASRPSAHAP